MAVSRAVKEARLEQLKAELSDVDSVIGFEQLCMASLRLAARHGLPFCPVTAAVAP